MIPHPATRRNAKASRPISATARKGQAVSPARKRGRHVVPGANVVRKAVQQDDREALRITAFLEADIQDRRLDSTYPWSRGALGPYVTPVGQTTGQDAHGNSELEKISAAVLHGAPRFTIEFPCRK